MARLIDAEFIEKYINREDHNTPDERWRPESEFAAMIDNAPTVDAVEVMQQFWKKTTEEKPSSSRHLIVTDGGLISHYGYYVKPKDKWFKTWECKEEIPEPAFWMDMPEPPAESIRDECGC